jgi:two-component system KDP operon response regulator KdpE
LSATPKRVLICDDEPQIVRALRVVLRQAGYETIEAETAEQAIDLAALHAPVAAIVDLMLPDGDGVEVCKRIREWSEMPIIVLSAIDDESEKVRALEMGADDYVTKPFAPRELVARLGAALRRSNGPGEPIVSIDSLEVDFTAREIKLSGGSVHLTPKEYALLEMLVRNRDRLLTSRMLLTEIWGPGYAQDTAVLRTHIARVRSKIEPEGQPRRIKTDPGIGYRFVS